MNDLSLITLPNASNFLQLPIQPDEGFPQAFQLSFNGKLYLFTFSISFLTLEPFKVWEGNNTSTDGRNLRGMLSVPISTTGARVALPWSIQGDVERTIYALPQDDLYLVMKLERQDLPAGQRILGITRPELGIPFRIGDLVFLFTQIAIARGNLLGAGTFGSQITAGVMLYGA